MLHVPVAPEPLEPAFLAGAPHLLHEHALNLVANFVYALMGGIVRPASAAGALIVIMRAEAFKIALILLQLFLAVRLYRELVVGPFVVAFIVTALMFAIALRAKG